MKDRITIEIRRGQLPPQKGTDLFPVALTDLSGLNTVSFSGSVKGTVSNPRLLSTGGGFFLTDSSIEFFRYISGIFVKNELARSMVNRF